MIKSHLPSRDIDHITTLSTGNIIRLIREQLIFTPQKLNMKFIGTMFTTKHMTLLLTCRLNNIRPHQNNSLFVGHPVKKDMSG